MATVTVSKAPSRLSFYPKADSAVLFPTSQAPLPPRPRKIGPILDPENLCKPLAFRTLEEQIAAYPPKNDEYAPSPIPPKQPPQSTADRYLNASLATNERLRLSMLWYYTRDLDNETEFLQGLQEKLLVAQESSDWDCVIIGVLDLHVYIRLATIGVPLAILPRGETLCAHTVVQPPGSVLLMPNMKEDWRFQQSPYVEKGGLVAYAGVPLRLQNDAGDVVGLGSLCVCSTQGRPPLTKSQQNTLTRVADWVVSDVIQCTRARRQRERQRMTQLLATAQEKMDAATDEESVFQLLQTTYPNADISLQPLSACSIVVDGRDPIPIADLDNGMWEDTAFLDDFIANSNYQDLPRDRTARLLSARCDSVSGRSLLIVATKDFRSVFDDIDSWFIQACAMLCSQIWNKRLLAEAMKTKEKFLRGFSHQLRTPIHGILGSAELLAEELRSQHLHEEADRMTKMLESFAKPKYGDHSVYLDTIKTSGRDLISIVNNMINLNKWVDVAMKDRFYTSCTVEQLQLDLAHELSKAAAGDARYTASVVFDHNIPADHDGIRTEISLLRESLLPLIFNAIHNTPDGVVSVTISIRPGRKDLLVDVEDSGCGIHPDDQQRIFEPYEKIDPHTTGAGLGLTLASKFATLLHGSINLVASDLGHGSHFRAEFHDMESQYAPHPSSLLTNKLQNLPRQFHYKASRPQCTLLSDFVARFLTSQGFITSLDQADCFIILEFVSDLEQFRAQLSTISSEQVVICPIPAIDVESSVETWNNVVYVRGPFMASTLISALEEANGLASRLRSSEADQIIDETISPMLSQADFNQDTKLVTIPEKVKELSTLLHGDSAACVDMTLVTPPRSRAPSELSFDPVLEKAVTIFPTPETCAKPMALLVDDNTVNLRILQMYCKKRSLPFLCAQDGEQAVDLFSKQQSLYIKGEAAPIHLILMDLQMPICDGINATKRIRALERQKSWGRSILFVVTGQDSPTDRADAEDAEADNFYVKPVAIKTLDSGLKRYFPLLEIP
ncbi:histidine kinase HHK3 [Xylariaceae sp. FL0255]|nr:histidine kinase HHK3 [Xylariaceae sp. FL0255]